MLLFSCSKSDDKIAETSVEESSNVNNRESFVLNNLKIESATVKNWISNDNYEKIVLTFFSSDLRSVGSNMTLASYSYEKGENYPSGIPVVFENRIKKPPYYSRKYCASK